MARYALKAQRFFLPGGPTGPGYLEVCDRVFGRFSKEAPEGLEVRDLGGSWVAPGLVDVHIHGFLDHDVMDGSEESLAAMAAELPRTGTTSFLATTLTAPVDETTRACQVVGDHVDAPKAAKVEGVHLEGPFFTEKHKGAQNGAYLIDPSAELLETWIDACAGKAVKTDLAPERAGAAAYCAKAVELGCVVAIGHSDATYDEAKACVDAGATVFVHTYNGMSGFTHREPGMVGCALSTPETYAELICDGHHVHPAAAKVAIRAKGVDHVVLITDCMRAGGMPEGDYLLGELPVVVKDGTARLKEGGNLAGSILELDRAVKNVVDWGLVSPAEAVQMATLNPARSAGIDDVCGQILPGRDADLCVFTPSMEHVATYVAGELAWEF